MTTEIETRFLNIYKEDLISKLIKLNATDEGERELNEIIFYDKDLKWMKENKFIRLRKQGDKIKLTLKQNAHQKIDTAKEIEFAVSDMEEARQFLKELDLIEYRVVQKFRHTFKLLGVTLDLDTWPKIPPYVELEGSSVENLQDVAKILGFDWETRFDKDARYVFQHYGYDFDNIRTVTFDKFE